MAMGGYSAIKTLLLLFSIAQSGLGQIPDPPNDITDNFCSNTAGFNVENLSCPNSNQNGQECIRGSALCNGVSDCTNNEDEGDEVNFNSLQCDENIFECGGGLDIAISSLCNGILDCVPDPLNTQIRGAADEINGLCDNKCLLPYYGGCDYTRECQTSRLQVTCGGCLEDTGRVEVDPAVATCQVMSIPSITVTEGDTGLELCFTLSLDSSVNGANFDQQAIISGITFSSQSATIGGNGNDATLLDSSLTFTFGDTEDCLIFTVTDDSSTENTEIVQVNIPGVGIGSVTILDNDVPEYGFSQVTYNTNEVGPLSVTVQITNGIVPQTTQVVTFIAANTGNGASFASAADYTSGSYSVTFNGGQSAASTDVLITSDTFDENTEQFGLTLQNPSFGTLNSALDTATVFISDDDQLSYGFSPLTYSVSEGIGQSSVTIVETTNVILAAGVTRSIFISSSVAGISSPATATVDFGNVPSTEIQITSANQNSLSFAYTVIDDDFNEGQEMFNFILSVPTGGDVSITPGSGTASVTIVDNDLLTFVIVDDDDGANDGQISAEEGVPTVQVCVQLSSGIPSNPVTISMVGTPGVAIAADFSLQSGTLFFPANSPLNTERCGTFIIVDDSIQEQTECFTAEFSGATFANNQDSIPVCIIDNDDVFVEFTQPTYFVGEGAENAQAAIRLAPSSEQPSQQIIVQVLTDSGSATSGVDFMATSVLLTFPAFSNPNFQQTFLIPIVDDEIVENQEDIELRATVVSGSAAFSAGGDEAAVQIQDDDELEVRFQFSEYSMLEVTDQTVCLDVVSGTLAPGISVSAQISTSNFASNIPADCERATPGADYDPTPSPSQVTFSSGGVTTQCVTLDITDDALDEEDEECFAVLAAPQTSQISIPIPQTLVRIGDDDLIIMRFRQPMYTVIEGNTNGVQICLDITSGIVSSTGGLSISVVSDPDAGGATENEDYFPVNIQLNFPAGSTTGQQDGQCFLFIPTNDNCVEFLEMVRLVASAPNNPDVVFTQNGGDTTYVSIVDDDEVTAIISPSPPFTVNEADTSLEVCVQLVTTPGVQLIKRPVSFFLYTEDGSAVGGSPGVQSDYCTENFTVTFDSTNEDESICNDIVINDDDICEDTETFSIDLGSNDPAGNTPVSSGGTVSIIDDDIAIITASQTEYSVPENFGVFEIPLFLQGEKAPGRQCQITASFLDGTAVSSGVTSIDYVSDVQQLILDSSERVANVMVELINDGICEGIETFEVFLTSNSPSCQIEAGLSPISFTIVDDEVGGGGDDPHFSIVLPGGKLLCYTVQGEHGFSFNLISNKKMTMNARFVPDSRRSEVTWMGSMGIIVRENAYKQENATALRFEALEKKIYIGDKVELEAKNIERMTFRNGKLMISEATPTDNFKYPSIYIDLQDVDITFTMKFMTEHLDIFWHKTGGKIPDSHGIIGQFFRTGVEIDEVRKILIMPSKEPVPVMRRPVWSFMERETVDNQLCWTAMNPGYQGEGLIDGHYFDYLVDDVMTSEFQFTKKE